MDNKTIKWFARGGDIAKMGPFNSQVEATKSLLLVKRKPDTYDRYPPNAFVWPEEIED